MRPNHTFFFLAYQHMALMQPYVWNQPVPSLAVRATAAAWAQPVMGVFPEPNQGLLDAGLGNWVGRSVQPAELNAGSVRLDQAIGRRASAFGRYGDSPSSNRFGNLSVNRIDLRFQSLTLGLTVPAHIRHHGRSEGERIAGERSFGLDRQRFVARSGLCAATSGRLLSDFSGGLRLPGAVHHRRRRPGGFR